MNRGSLMNSISAITVLIGMMKKAANRTVKDAMAEVLTMADLIERDYLIGKFEDTGPPALSEMCKGYDLGIKAALRVVKKAPAVNRWISCSERFPENDEPVLITCNSLCVHKAWYDDVMHRFNISDSDYWYREDAVLAWMPMPDAYEPPEVTQDEQT